MTLNIQDIRFDADLPKLPDTAPVLRCAAPCYDDREKGVHALAERLDLGRVQQVDTEFGRMMASDRGGVEYFAASGAIWSSNHVHELKGDSEFLDWDDLSEDRDADGQPVLTLGRAATEQALSLAHEMAEIGGFDMAHAQKPQLRLVQVAEADEKGRTLRTGAGEATVVFGYALDDLPVIGAGGKTLVDLIPARGTLQPTGAINVWRSPTEAAKVRIGGTETALAAGLLEDPDLNLAVKQGGRITIQRARLGLMALPAAIHQSVLFPALEYEARVDLPERDEHYFVGRVAPVATPKAYAAAGVGSTHLGLGMR
ncbi:MAG: hypothetical protein OIF47_14260 [Marinibacterium sp.]|nr:hypothetical protein [Marinibacterium sp.]